MEIINNVKTPSLLEWYRGELVRLKEYQSTLIKNGGFDDNERVASDIEALVVMIEKLEKVVPAEQFESAHKLAAAYGHLWASFERGLTPRPVRIDEIFTASSQMQNEDLPAGIYSPELNKDGKIVHTTGSRRLRWEVASNGDVELQITRPGGQVCLRAEVFTKKTGPLAGQVLAHVERRGGYYARHVVALEGALSALCTENEVRTALSVAWDQCPDRVQHELCSQKIAETNRQYDKWLESVSKQKIYAQLLYDVAAGEYVIKKWTAEDLDKWEESGYRSQYGHFSEVGVFDNQKDLHHALEELRGKPVFAVFEDRASGSFWGSTEDGLSGNWLGSKAAPANYVTCFDSEDEAKDYLDNLRKGSK